MSRPLAPFDRDFPNLEGTLVEIVPLFCTILAGFVGLMFVTVATSTEVDKVLHETWFRPFVIIGPALGPVPGKAFVLWASATDFFLFYFCIMFVIYAKMSDYRGVATSDQLKAALADPDTLREVDRLDRRRDQFITACMFFFNLGVIALPLILIPFAKRWLEGLVFDLCIVVFVYALWSIRKRLQ